METEVLTRKVTGTGRELVTEGRREVESGGKNGGETDRGPGE